MKKLITILLLTANLIGYAECQYNHIELKLQITTKYNSIITCYAGVSSCEFRADSIDNKSYMIRILRQGNTNDTICVYKNMISYEYFVFDTVVSKIKNTINKFIDKVDLQAKDIESFNVIEYKKVSSLDQIATQLELADTSWLSTNPIERKRFGAYLCSFQIFIYEKNKNTEILMKQLMQLQEEIDPIMDTMSQEKREEYDEKIWRLIHKMKDLNKIVVVSSCSD